MKQVEGFWLPTSEEHLVDFLKKGPRVHGGPTYQYHKLSKAMQFVSKARRDRAVDVGAHCGLWSRVLAYDFKNLDAFEPVAAHRECFVRNVIGAVPANVNLYPYALGDQSGLISLHTGPSSSGDTYVKEGGEHSAELRTLDSFNLPSLDFLKIDCEGYEYYVLKGAELTVRKFKPVIIVEQKPNKGSGNFHLHDTAAVELLQGWGAKLKFEYAGDYCLAW